MNLIEVANIEMDCPIGEFVISGPAYYNYLSKRRRKTVL